jgi:predicted Zn-dependent peptidase
MMYKELVEQKHIALEAEAIATYPDGRYPNLFLFFLVPGRGHTVEENQKALDGLLERFLATPVDSETLNRVKTKVRASVIRRLDSNAGLASSLASAHAGYGDWRKLFTEIDDLNKVTAADVARVARQCFVTKSRTVAYTVNPGAGGAR